MACRLSAAGIRRYDRGGHRCTRAAESTRRVSTSSISRSGGVDGGQLTRDVVRTSCGEAARRSLEITDTAGVTIFTTDIRKACTTACRSIVTSSHTVKIVDRGLSRRIRVDSRVGETVNSVVVAVSICDVLTIRRRTQSSQR